MATTGDESTSLEPELPKEPAPSFASGRPSRSLQGKIIAGKYRIEELVAQGGIGQVYLSTQLPLGRKVAVKVVLRQPGDGEFRKRFLLEASVCARLAHNNIVVCYDYGETFDGDLFMAMEYLGRRSLAAVLREERRLAPLRACRIALQIAKALRVAHRAGIIHRDLNASNVMLVADPESAEADLVKVVDFGLAKVFGGADDVRSAVPVTRPGIVLGSPRYMSPEQVQSREVDGRADIYALGVVMFEMLTGRVPFEGTHPSEIMTQHVRDLPPALADVAPDVSLPHQVEGLVHRCLEKNPDHRYLHAEDLIAELKRAIVLLGGDGSFDVSLSLRSASMPPARMSSTTQPALTMDPSFEGRLIVEASPGRWSSPWWGLALVLLALIASLAFWVYVLKI